jgi:predicted DNA-binding transcriptional regulator AlpA
MDAGIADRIAEIFDRAKAEALALLSDAVPSVEAGAGLLCARDVARRLQTNTQAVYRLAREGRLPAVKISTRSYRWTEEVVSAFIQANDTEQHGAKTLRLLRA